MHKPEFVQENEMQEVLWDCEIKTDHPIPGANKQEKRICDPTDFPVPAKHRVK